MIDLQIPLAGMNSASASLDRAASRIAEASSPAGDSVDLSAEMIALIEARTGFEANVSVAKAEDQVNRSLLNLLG